MPRSARPAGFTADPRNGRKGRLVASDVSVPDPPPKLSSWAIDRWLDFWSGPAAKVMSSADLPVAERWILCLDRWRSVSAEAAADPLVEGSQQQMVMNPLWKVSEMLAKQIRECEQTIGVGPLFRSALGVLPEGGQVDVGTDVDLQDLAAAFEDPRGL